MHLRRGRPSGASASSDTRAISASKSIRSGPCSNWPSIPDRPCVGADAIARKHLADIDDRIARLAALREDVWAMVAQCAGGHVRGCRIIEVLADHGECLHERH